MITVQSNLDSYSSGEEVTLTFLLDSQINASSGAVEVTPCDGVDVVSGSWQVSSPTLQIFDMKTNKGAFSYSSEKDITGDLFKLTFKTNSEIQKTMNVRLEFRDYDGTVLNETIAVNVDSTGQVIEPTKEVSSETVASATVTDIESAVVTTSSAEDSQETFIVVGEDGETYIVDADGNPVTVTNGALTESTEVAQEETSSGNAVMYVALGVIIAVIITAVIICFTRKKHKEDNPND